MTTLKILFWACIALVVYTYVGYGLLLWAVVLVKRLFCGKPDSSPALSDDELPPITFMICAYNEQEVVAEKMQNCRQLSYPADKLTIMWVTDGSSDDTNALLANYPDVRIVYSPERRGKTAALNHGMLEVTTPITVMTDANTMVNSNALREIARLMCDPKVACVAGEKRVAARSYSQTAAKGEGVYWRYESTLKRLDSELYSAMGAAGELNAIRTSLYEPMPENALLDDFVMSMRLVDKGYRIAYSSAAYAMEYGSANISEEHKRKRRIAAGGLQSVWWLHGMLNPFRHPVATFQYVSHRVLRWTVTPFALFMLVPLNVVLVMMKAGGIYTALWILQTLFYLAALGGHVVQCNGGKSKLFFIPYYFVFMNISVFSGIRYLARRNNSGSWEKAKRG